MRPNLMRSSTNNGRGNVVDLCANRWIVPCTIGLLLDPFGECYVFVIWEGIELSNVDIISTLYDDIDNAFNLLKSCSSSL